jgi:hypothetical protein
MRKLRCDTLFHRSTPCPTNTLSAGRHPVGCCAFFKASAALPVPLRGRGNLRHVASQRQRGLRVWPTCLAPYVPRPFRGAEDGARFTARRFHGPALKANNIMRLSACSLSTAAIASISCPSACRLSRRGDSTRAWGYINVCHESQHRKYFSYSNFSCI